MLTLFPLIFPAHPVPAYIQKLSPRSGMVPPGYIQCFNDHVKVSTISAGIQLLCGGLHVGMGDDVATKEVFEWVIGSNNDVIRACGEVTRFMDDMADFKVFIH